MHPSRRQIALLVLERLVADALERVDRFLGRHQAPALRRVAGVQAIALEIDVKLPPNPKRSDTDIAASAEGALSWNILVLLESILLTVDHGGITLQGALEWDYQRRGAEARAHAKRRRPDAHE